ncbi:MAG: response regulator, partial [Elusimicrobia bacterium]|nr:response regulator [Elusimicrobiota bacterium]
EIITARGADEALRRILDREFALMITDLRLPALNGLELCSMIRQRDRCRDMPVSILTGYDEDGAKALPGYRAGAFEFMRKPVEAEELRRHVARRAAHFRPDSENR